MTKLFTQIETMLKEVGHGWTTMDEASQLACCIMAVRPIVSVEIGVYAGKGTIAMAMAHREIGYGTVIGIDPWSPVASAEGQLNPDDKKFWGNLDHNPIFKLAQENIAKHGVQDFAKLLRSTSDDAFAPDDIGVLRIDGNHGEQVEKDVRKWCPKVMMGGFLMLDDLGWTGGAVLRAAGWVRQNGFREVCRVGTGATFQRV